MGCRRHQAATYACALVASPGEAAIFAHDLELIAVAQA
jgi:hypothetical protein